MSSAIHIETLPSLAGEVFTLKHAAVETVLNKQLFFIVGCQKSGTTWLQHLLHGHPEIACRGESVFVPIVLESLKQIIQVYNQRNKLGGEGSLDAADAQYLFATMFGLVLSKWGSEEGVRCVGEKTPEHTLASEMLAVVFPEAKFLHIIRDPRDIAVSGWFHNLRQKGDAFYRQFATIGDYAAFIAKLHWPGMVGRARAVGKAYPERYLELRYEDVLAGSYESLTKVLCFLDVDSEPPTVQACLDAGSFEKLSGGRESGKEDRGSFFRKGVSGDWKNHLDEQAVAVFAANIGPAMRELGYEV